MALQKDYNLIGGITIASAYHKVSIVLIDTINKRAEINVKIFKDKTTCDSDGDFAAEKFFDVTDPDFTNYLTPTVIDPLNINHVSQSYEYLKTLPEYQGALDV